MKHWFARQRYLADFTLSALLRRKGRNLMLLFIYTLASSFWPRHLLRLRSAS